MTDRSGSPATGLVVPGTQPAQAVATFESVPSTMHPWSWGNNTYGQLGIGSYNGSLTPVTVTLLSEVAAVAAHGDHSLALTPDGMVHAWGSNAYGQLGDGSTSNSTTPITVTSSLTDVTAIAAGSYHSIAVKGNGTVWTWGRNNWGQLGNNSTSGSYTPIQVSDPNDPSSYLQGVTAIAGGDGHSLALKSDGSVWAWGYNNGGELGDGTRTERHTPVKVRNPEDTGYLSDVVAIAAGDGTSLALKSDGTVWAWGQNWLGAVGNGTTAPNQLLPVQVLGPEGVDHLTGVVAIAGGWTHSLALKSDGTVWTWGANGSDQLGDGSQDNRTVPVRALGLNGVTAVAAGRGGHSLAIAASTPAVRTNWQTIADNRQSWTGLSQDPVNTSNGSYTYDHGDLAIPGRGPSPAFARAYNSND